MQKQKYELKQLNQQEQQLLQQIKEKQSRISQLKSDNFTKIKFSSTNSFFPNLNQLVDEVKQSMRTNKNNDATFLLSQLQIQVQQQKSLLQGELQILSGLRVNDSTAGLLRQQKLDVLQEQLHQIQQIEGWVAENQAIIQKL
ncbi:hypothetical protein pb186bvf_010196 [Paramecium bursaria]